MKEVHAVKVSRDALAADADAMTTAYIAADERGRELAAELASFEKALVEQKGTAHERAFALAPRSLRVARLINPHHHCSPTHAVTQELTAANHAR